MKEHFHGPQKWALVVISGGAACALPFVNSNEQPAAVRQQSPSGTSSALTTASDVEHMALPLPPPQFPEWANADRSPFDDLVGVKAREPVAVALADPLPLQPLQPWISGPADHWSNRARPDPATNVPRSALAGASDATPAEASPWRDQSGDWSGANALAMPSSTAPQSASVSTADSDAAWPDQKLSAEEVAQLLRPAHRELASAVIAPAPVLLGPARAGLHPHNSALSGTSVGSSTNAVAAAQRTSGHVAASSHASLTSQSSSALDSPPPFSPPSVAASSNTPPPFVPPPLSSPPAVAGTTMAAPPAAASSLPKLPEARKQHIIFQPSARR